MSLSRSIFICVQQGAIYISSMYMYVVKHNLINNTYLYDFQLITALYLKRNEKIALNVVCRNLTGNAVNAYIGAINMCFIIV